MTYTTQYLKWREINDKAFARLLKDFKGKDQRAAFLEISRLLNMEPVDLALRLLKSVVDNGGVAA